jgi:hypothetical protein
MDRRILLESGIMEFWNVGMMGEAKFLNPLFHYSIHPIFQFFVRREI